MVGYGIFLVLDPGMEDKNKSDPSPCAPSPSPRPSPSPPLTSRPKVPKSHVDGEVPKLADL